MGIVDDLLKRQAQMASDRYRIEPVWRDVVALFMPNASARFDVGGGVRGSLRGEYLNDPTAARRSKQLYDATAVWAGERLVAGVESLVTPRAQKWHGLTKDNPFSSDPSDVEEEWLDRLRDYLFTVRYDPKVNFSLANQKAIRSATILGTGILYSEENTGRRGTNIASHPMFYRSVPIIDCYLGVDGFDNVNAAIEMHDMTARAAADYFGADKLPDVVKRCLESPAKVDETFTFMHAVVPREEAGDYKTKRSGMEFASFWAEVSTRTLIRDSGFYTFPYSVMWWDQIEGSAYGQSAPMSLLSDVKMLQVMSRAATESAQNMVKPPMATMAGIYSQRLNLNPGAVNPGLLGDNGMMKVQPVMTGANPGFAERIIELKREGIREGLYINLFQALVQNPQMTATEAIIRANEKGEMLGPAGAKIEHGLSKAVDREVDIIGRAGAFEPGSALEPPEILVGQSIGVNFTGPMARLRRMADLQGVEAVLTIAGGLAQYDPSVLDRIDSDETLEIAREIRGAPRKMFRTDKEVTASRTQRAQQAEQQAAMQMMGGMADAAGKATPALQAMMGAQG
jgi:Bacteriophage head to tail connecting protein